MNVDPHKKLHFRLTIGRLLRETVFGYNDGVVSTFAVIAGLYGGGVENKTILLGALATLAAGAFSMGLGTFLGVKSEKEHYESEVKRELWEMENIPHVERKEIEEIYKKKGFKGELLEKIVEKIVNNPKLWLETMLREELGFAKKPPNPHAHGIAMSSAFVIGSGIVTLPFLFEADSKKLFVISCAIMVIMLFMAGALKTYITKRNAIRSAIETFLVGALASLASYYIGVLIAG